MTEDEARAAARHMAIGQREQAACSVVESCLAQGIPLRDAVGIVRSAMRDLLGLPAGVLDVMATFDRAAPKWRDDWPH